MSDIEWKLQGLKQTVKYHDDNEKKKQENEQKVREYKGVTLEELDKIVKATSEQDDIISGIDNQIFKLKETVARKQQQLFEKKKESETKCRDKIKKELENLEYLKSYKAKITAKELNVVKIILSLSFLQDNFIQKDLFTISKQEIESMLNNEYLKMIAEDDLAVVDDHNEVISQLATSRESKGRSVGLSELLSKLNNFNVNYQLLYSTYLLLRTKLSSMQNVINNLNDRCIKMEISKDSYIKRIGNILSFKRLKVRDMISFNSKIKEMLDELKLEYNDEIKLDEKIQMNQPVFYLERYNEIENCLSFVKTKIEELVCKFRIK